MLRYTILICVTIYLTLIKKKFRLTSYNFVQDFRFLRDFMDSPINVKYSNCEKKCKFETESKKQKNCLEKCLSEIKKNKKEIVESKLNFPKNYCLNLKNPEEMLKKDILKEFAKGPCSPLMLVPGVMATKLILEIDCEKLRKFEPETFSQCGWNACEKKFYEFWKDIPKKEYDLWIPALTGPLNIFTIFEKTRMCFSKLIVAKFDRNQPIEKMVKKRKGIKISTLGFSDQTKKSKTCGKNAIGDLLNWPVQIDETRQFSVLMRTLEHLGYTNGLTYQAAPYNFYLSITNNQLTKNFSKIIKNLKKYTGKKVGIVAHSMGSNNVLINLSKMTKKFKKNYIHNFLAITPGFSGCLRANTVILSGFQDFSFMGMGFNFKAATLATTNQLSLYELTGRDAFSLYKNEPWFKNILKRLEYEKNPKIGFENSGIPFWPSIKDKCYEKNFNTFSQECKIGIEDSSKKYIKVGDKRYGINDMEELYKKYRLSEHVLNTYKKTFSNILLESNPGVPTVIMYLNSIKTANEFHYNKDLDETLKNKQFGKIIYKGYGRGDDTVSTYGALLPGFKWAFAYEKWRKEKSDLVHQVVKDNGINKDNRIRDTGNDKDNRIKNIIKDDGLDIKDNKKNVKKVKVTKKNKKEENKTNKNNNKTDNISEEEFHPVKFAEICSLAKNKNTVYDKFNKNGEKQMTENSYIGVYCRCFGKNASNYSDCQHAKITVDPYVINFVVKFADSYQIADPEVFEFLDRLDEDNPDDFHCSYRYFDRNV